MVQPVRIYLQWTVIPIKTHQGLRKDAADISAFNNVFIGIDEPLIIHSAKTMRQRIRVNKKTQTTNKN